MVLKAGMVPQPRQVDVVQVAIAEELPLVKFPQLIRTARLAFGSIQSSNASMASSKNGARSTSDWVMLVSCVQNFEI